MFDFFLPTKNYSCLGERLFFLLSKYTKAETICRFDDVNRWNDLMSDKPSRVVKYLQKKGMLRLANIPEILISSVNTNIIKEYLRKNKLNTTGKKSVLVQRLVDGNCIKQCKIHNAKDYLIVTDYGLEMVNKFLNGYNSKEQNIIIAISQLLENKKYERAVESAKNYINTRYFEESMLSYWDNYEKYEKNDIILWVEDIMSAAPSILSDLDETSLNNIKIATVISSLLGFGYRKRNLLSNFQVQGYKYDFDICKSFLIVYADAKKVIRECKRDGFRYVKVSSGCSTPCEFYEKHLKDKTFNLKQIPEIPLPECSNPSSYPCHLSIALRP